MFIIWYNICAGFRSITVNLAREALDEAVNSVINFSMKQPVVKQTFHLSEEAL